MKRKLKVSSQYQGNKAVPTIIIKGEWVKTANFKEGDYVELDVSDEKIVITKTTPPERKKGLVEEKGFFILPSELFCNVRKNAANDENLNETLERVFRHIEESAKGTDSEDDFTGLFDDIDVNSNKLGSTVARYNCRKL